MALIKCKECGTEISNKAVTCPKCGAPVKVARKPMGCGTVMVALFFAGVIATAIKTMPGSSSSDSATSPATATLVQTHTPVACDRQAAEKVRRLVQQAGKITQDSGFVRVQWGSDFFSWGEDAQLTMAKTFANADACLSGSAREIRFYSPAGKFNAVATPTAGVRLVD